MPEWLLPLLGGGLGAASLTFLAAWLKLRQDRRVTSPQMEEAALKRARECEEREREQEVEAEAAVTEIRRLVGEIDRLTGTTRHLEQRLRDVVASHPVAATLDALRRVESAWAAICAWELPIVLSSDRDGGSFERVTPTFAALLGMTPEEICAAGPWKLIDPTTSQRTRLAEGDARAGDAVVVGNAYVGRKGRVRLLWLSTSYVYFSDPSAAAPPRPGAEPKVVGYALSLVRVRRPERSKGEPP